MTGLSPFEIESLNETAKWITRSGYYNRDGAILKVAASAEDAGVPEFGAAKAVDDEIASLKTDALDWPAITDVDRLTAAFAELRQADVIALPNFGLGPSDAMSDLREVVSTARAKGETISGYVMFNEQRTQDCVLGYPILSLQFGIPENDVSEERAIAFARKLMTALEVEGLTVKWGGDSRDVIEVRLEWRARWKP